MGLYSMMRTSSSGMGAQANRLATVAENIGNSSTVGYKRASTEFSSILLQSGTADYTSGSVETEVRYHISEQGAMRYSTSATDLAVNGQGFFIVENSNGQSFLTRAGSFVKDGEGNLVNAGGFKLMGYDLALGRRPRSSPTASAAWRRQHRQLLAAGQPVDGRPPLLQSSLQRRRCRGGEPAGRECRRPPSTAARRRSSTYDSLGNEVTLDIYCGQERRRHLADQRVQPGQRRRRRRLSLHGRGAASTTTLKFNSIGQLTTSSPTSLVLHHPERRGLHARPVGDRSSSRPTTAS